MLWNGVKQKKRTVEPCSWSDEWVLHEKLDSLILLTLNEHGNSHIRDLCCSLFVVFVLCKKKKQILFTVAVFLTLIYSTADTALGTMTFGFFMCSMSEGMQRCRWSVSASCLWQSSLFKSPLKHRTALYPPQRGRGVANISLCFRLARQPNSTSFHQEWSRMLMVACLLQSFQWFLQTSGCRQASVLICWSLSKQQAP